jgi:hypothetical protein
LPKSRNLKSKALEDFFSLTIHELPSIKWQHYWNTARSTKQAAACAAFQIALSSQAAAAPYQCQQRHLLAAALTKVNIQPEGDSGQANAGALSAGLILYAYSA